MPRCYCSAVVTSEHDNENADGTVTDVSLSNGKSGLVYITVDNQMGTVCRDHFNNNDNACRVVCRQLGYR